MRRLLILHGLVLVLLAGSEASAQAHSADEAELKAAYLFNFAMFVEWPPSDSQTFTVCQYGGDSLGSGADALARRNLRGKSIVVRRVTGKDFGDCSLLYIPSSDKTRIRELTHGLRGSNVLTVSDARDAARDGAAIGLSLDGRRLVFEVNVAEARRNHLVISAKLLSLAQSVLDAP